MVIDKKIIYWTTILFIAFAMYKMVDSLGVIVAGIKYLFSLMAPFLWAFAVAYLLNPAMKLLERRFKIDRIASVAIVYSVVVGLIVLFFTIVSPRVISSISEIVQQIPQYLQTTQSWIQTNIISSNWARKYEINDYIQKNLNAIVAQAGDFLNIILNKIVKFAIGFTSTFFSILIGILISVYILADKEGFARNTRRFVYSLAGKEHGDSFFELTREIDSVFSKFIVGKFIDSLIIGLICLAGTLLLKMPYAFLIALIVGITNMIPYFGPFIGIIPSVIIVLFNDPIKALWLFVFILLLQQFDGWILGPKILGDKVGMSPFWIILAIIIGGGTLGVLGMFLAVPTFAVLKNLLERYVDKKLKLRDIEIG